MAAASISLAQPAPAQEKAETQLGTFGAWWSYVYPSLEGFELREEQAKKGRGAWTYGSKERQEFAEFYAAEASAAASAARQSGSSTAQLYGLTCTGPVKYVGHTAIKRDTENLAAAVHVTRAEDAFMTAVSPATLQILRTPIIKAPRTTPGRLPRRSAMNTGPS